MSIPEIEKYSHIISVITYLYFPHKFHIFSLLVPNRGNIIQSTSKTKSYIKRNAEYISNLPI